MRNLPLVLLVLVWVAAIVLGFLGGIGAPELVTVLVLTVVLLAWLALARRPRTPHA